MKWWMISASVCAVVAAIAGCGTDNAPSFGDPGSGGTSVSSGSGGRTATGGAPATGLVRLGTGQGFVGEDPVVMMTAGLPALGYTADDNVPRLRFFENGTWSMSVGDPTDGPGAFSTRRSNGFCSDGTSVYLAHTRFGSKAGDLFNHLFVYRYQARTWTSFGGGELGLSDVAVESPLEPGISCPVGAEPTVTWVQASSRGDTSEKAGWVATLTSGSAVRAGPLEAIAGTQVVAHVPVTSVVSVPGGTSYAATWEYDDQGGAQLFVYQVSGASVAAMGAAVGLERTPVTQLPPDEPAIDVASGAPIVAWAASATTAAGRDVFVARWTGSNWAAIGGPVRGLPDTHFSSNTPALAVDNGEVYVAWVEWSRPDSKSVLVARLSGADWTLIGGAQNIDPARSAENPSIAVVDGVIYLTFEESVDGVRQIFVKAGRP